jgi:hypothetical protein
MIKSPIVAVDPGIHGLGVSFFNDGELKAAKYIRGAVGKASPAHVKEVFDGFYLWASETAIPENAVLVMEWPRIYVGGASGASRGANPNDLLWLSAVNGALMSDWSGVSQLVEPGRWKGNMPTETVVLARVVGTPGCSGRLCSRELLIFRAAYGSLPKSLAHNLIDGVGIGLWATGRL